MQKVFLCSYRATCNNKINFVVFLWNLLISGTKLCLILSCFLILNLIIWTWKDFTFLVDGAKTKDSENASASKSPEEKEFSMEVPVIDLKSMNKVSEGTNFLYLINQLNFKKYLISHFNIIKSISRFANQINNLKSSIFCILIYWFLTCICK